MNSRNEEYIQIDLQALLTPASILLSGILISASIFFGGGIGGGTRGSSSSDEFAEPVYALVDELGLDVDDFAACVEANDTAEIEKDLADGTAAGITGTPAFIIGFFNEDTGEVDGTIVSGAQPLNVFQDTINTYLRGERVVINETNATTYPGEAKINIDDDPVLGNENKAKVAIVEFSDFECPFCQRHHQQTHDSMISEFVDSNEAIFVFRDFPLSIHEPKATTAAVYANCALELGDAEIYYEFSKMYFEKTLSNGQGLPQ